MSSASLSWLLAQSPDSMVHINCMKSYVVGGFEQHRFRQHYGTTMRASEALTRWGDITVAEIERRAVCSVCRAKAMRVEVTIPAPGFSAGGYAASAAFGRAEPTLRSPAIRWAKRGDGDSAGVD